LPKNFRPCLNYHIGKCPAPCINAISKEDYKARIDKAIEFLSGNDKEALTLLTQKMTDASEKEQYEEALNYRNYIQVINKLQESRIATLRRIVDYDIFAISSNGNNAVVNHTVVRAGKVVLSDNIPVSDAGIDEKQTLTSYISLYGDYNTLCGDIITNLDLEDSNTLSSFLSVKCNRKITVSVGARGERRKLAEMSYVNACDFLVKSESSINKEYNRTLGAVTQLKEVLSLSRIPNRIECYDISNISGVDKVASMVVTQNGKADNSSYRRFKIKTVEGANDFACMKEVLSRRFAKLKEGDLRFGASPDLIVVDGGLGQLSYAMEAKKEAGVDIEIISLAEKEELVYTERNNEPIFLPRNSFALNLLTNTRDEAHRFAITYFRSLHEKNSLKTILSEISGIGDKKQLALFKSFKTADNIKKATQEEIAKVDGISKANAKAVYEFFKERTDEV
ncbi:MAG: excinuclease ABC subunit UvrC, partial [Clostridia bacterium]